MNWISIKDKLPADNCMCLVINEKRPNTYLMTIYDSYDETFDWYEPSSRHAPMALVITHYIEIPYLENEWIKLIPGIEQNLKLWYNRCLIGGIMFDILVGALIFITAFILTD